MNLLGGPLKFLGDVSPANVELLTQMLSVEVNRHPAFEIQFEGLGAFPNPRRPRVIWIGIQAPAGLEALQHGIEAATATLDYPAEKRPFSPHLTIGRVKNMGTPRMLAEAMADGADIGWGESVVDRIHLVRSELFPSGPRYSILHDARFAP